MRVGYNFTIIPSARDSDELKYIIDNAIVENWKPAGYSHLTTFLHARDNGFKDFWNIDADDIGLYAKPRKIAKILKRVKDYSINHGMGIMSLDCWITESFGKTWSFGVSYTNNSIDWIGLLKKHCKDDAHVEHYKKIGIPNNADEFVNYLRKVEDVKVETFYVENLHAVHNHANIFNTAYWGVRHWSKGRCYWHNVSEIFGMGKAGSLPIPDVEIKFDIGLTIEESFNAFKYFCQSDWSFNSIKSFERKNNVTDSEITAILPLDGTIDDVRICLGNLLAQNFKDFRLIVTDAGLSKVALEICRQAQNFFNGRMKIITDLPKEKLFDAGLKAAKGRYVIFINGKEAFIPQAFAFLFGIISSSRADVVHTSNFLVPQANNIFSIGTYEPAWGQNIQVPILLQGLRDKFGVWVNNFLSPTIFNKLIRREFLEEEKISLPFTDDMTQWIFSLQCLLLAEKFVRVPQPLYARIAEMSPLNSEKDFFTRIKILAKCIEALEKLDDEIFYFDEYTNEKALLRNIFVKTFLGNA